MNWLKMQAQQRPNKKFINEMTFKEIDLRVTDLAGRLYPYVKGQRRVAMLAYNSVETVLFFLALQTLQIEVLMLNVLLTPKEINQKLNNLNIRVVFSQDNTFTSFQEVLQSTRQDYPTPAGAFHPEQIGVIMDTSGTSGKYKSVPLRWKQFAAHAQGSQEVLGVTEEDNWLMLLPMYHVGGLTVLLRCLYSGISITLLEKFDEERTLQLVADESVNILSMVPTMLNRIVERIHEHQLRVVLVGGEFIYKPIAESCLAKKIPLFKTYGLTENTSQVTTFNIMTAPHKLDSVGLPLPGMMIRINEPDAAGIGEVCIKGPMLMDGYLGQAPVADFFNTQDIGYIDEDGYLYLLDRRKNIIISGGENIYPQEIENVLYAHPNITECAVVGVKDEKWGQAPVLFVVSSLDEQSIREYLTERIAKFKLPREIIHLTDLPKNATGKIAKNKLVGLLN